MSHFIAMLVGGMGEDLEWLQGWYAAACDGDWEHEFGISIDTLDNPGWALKIDLAGTVFANRTHERTSMERTATDWHVWEVTGHTFTAYGGPKNLSELIQIFRSWIESSRL